MEIIAKIDNDAKIAVLYGGLSNERAVSLRSGKNVFEALKRLGYRNVELIDVDENIAQVLKDKEIEYAYNALHGKYGEDGCVQGVLELLKIPYTGCGVMASSVCMNKQYTKDVLKAYGVNLIKSVFVKKEENVLEKIADLKYPMMIKPVCEGSSIGMAKVNNEEELKSAFEESIKIGQDIMIEEFLVGTDLTVGVLQDGENTFATEILQMHVEGGWYDYKAKYTKGMTEFILPARISDEATKQIKQMAIDAFNALGCKGVSRIDFLLCDDIPYILEVNTSPGMTDLSDLPAQALKCGIDYDNLVQLILNGVGLNK
ncbi:D-alanine--D-alanine ligase [bacterium]|nr:D-alanine--D-alanine ligase [bacterium]